MYLPLSGSEPTLFGYRRFNEGDGQVINDATPFANSGTLGPTIGVEPEDPLWSDPVPYLAFFYDGFKSGGTSAWSATVP